jgi:hypothetical protein
MMRSFFCRVVRLVQRTVPPFVRRAQLHERIEAEVE